MISRQLKYQYKMISLGRCAICGRKRKKYKRRCNSCQSKVNIKENERQKRKRRELLGLPESASRSELRGKFEKVSL